MYAGLRGCNGKNTQNLTHSNIGKDSFDQSFHLSKVQMYLKPPVRKSNCPLNTTFTSLWSNFHGLFFEFSSTKVSPQHLTVIMTSHPGPDTAMRHHTTVFDRVHEVHQIFHSPPPNVSRAFVFLLVSAFSAPMMPFLPQSLFLTVDFVDIHLN